MEGLDIISENINSSIETKIELMNQEDCEHDWIKGRGDYNIKCAFTTRNVFINDDTLVTITNFVTE